MGEPEVGPIRWAAARSIPRAQSLWANLSENGSLFRSGDLAGPDEQLPGKRQVAAFLGLLSDGNVHSNISHLIAMLKSARALGIRRCYCHILLDGRDVPATSALTHVDELEQTLAAGRGL